MVCVNNGEALYKATGKIWSDSAGSATGALKHRLSHRLGQDTEGQRKAPFEKALTEAREITMKNGRDTSVTRLNDLLAAKASIVPKLTRHFWGRFMSRSFGYAFPSGYRYRPWGSIRSSRAPIRYCLLKAFT